MRLRPCLASFAAALAITAAPGQAQVLGGGGLPPVGVPSLPGGGLDIPAMDRPVRERLPRRPLRTAVPELPAASAADRLLAEAGALAGQARALALQSLIRDHPEAVEADDQGQPVVRGRILSLAPTDSAVAAAERAGFAVTEQDELAAVGVRIVVLRPPAGVSAREAIARLRALDPAGEYDYDHIYLGAGEAAGSSPATQGRGSRASAVRIGLVDTGVAAGHPSLRGARIEQRGFAPGGLNTGAHGTAVASLLVGQGRGFRSAAPGASLYVADVYGAAPAGGSALLIARALAWLAQSGAPVVNVSLVGPHNRVLEAAVRGLTVRGHLLVAAVGNDGPAAPPLYPAAYPGVVAVTGVDARGRVLLEAGRGPHVDFAAPGADMAAADPQGGFTTARGTSFAAPLVAGELARRLAAPDPAAAARALAALGRSAADLGLRGRDATFGAGLVAADKRTAPAAVGAKARVLAGR